MENLGKKAISNITGFKGIITQVNIALNNSTSYLIVSECREGKSPESYWEYSEFVTIL